MDGLVCSSLEQDYLLYKWIELFQRSSLGECRCSKFFRSHSPTRRRILLLPRSIQEATTWLDSVFGALCGASPPLSFHLKMCRKDAGHLATSPLLYAAKGILLLVAASLD